MRRLAITQPQRLLAVLGIVALLAGTLTVLALAAPVRAASTAPLLPGETLWGGVPSYLFGLGDTYDYIGAPGFEQNTTIQAQVKSAHVPLIRAFFESVDETDHTTPVPDSKQLAIAEAIVNSGAQCLANITQPVSVSQALHLVHILAPYCRFFEIYNEPDIGSGNWPPAVDASSYLSFWNSFVPQARSIDPQGLFGGPALAYEFGLDDPNYMQTVLTGMAQSGVTPDFITYHWYVCSGLSSSDCLTEASQWPAGHGKTVYGWLKQDFPTKTIPLGISEWGADPGNPPWGYNDGIMQQFEQEALASFETNPYLSFLTQFDIASYAGYGTLDLFRTSNPEATDGSTVLDYTNTPAAIGSPRPMFTTLAGEIARLSTTSGPEPTATTAPPSPTPVPPTPVIPRYAHVITIMEENHSYSDIVGSSSAPYINGTLLKEGALATNYTANVQSSLPNYLILSGGSDLGLSSNCEPSVGCESSGPSIASEALAAGETWKAYEENMTANCQNVVDGGTGGLYTIHHNPFPYYTNLASCATNDVPFTQLAHDLQSPTTLPSYVFITPNLNDDMHNGTVNQGDTWLSQEIPALQQSPACAQSTCLIVITWDEGSYDASGNPLSPHVATIFLGPFVNAGATDAGAYSHFNLLRTEELALGLPTMTANDAAAAPMAGMFVPSSEPTPTPTPTPPTPTPSPTPSPTPIPPTPTPNPSPSPSPTPPPNGVPCIELVNGVMTVGVCTGTFVPTP